MVYEVLLFSVMSLDATMTTSFFLKANPHPRRNLRVRMAADVFRTLGGKAGVAQLHRCREPIYTGCMHYIAKLGFEGLHIVDGSECVEGVFYPIDIIRVLLQEPH